MMNNNDEQLGINSLYQQRSGVLSGLFFFLKKVVDLFGCFFFFSYICIERN